jgi:hypothetical protein
MYFCVKGIDFVSFYDCSIRFWNCSDSVVFFIFHFFKYTYLYVCVFIPCCICPITDHDLFR